MNKTFKESIVVSIALLMLVAFISFVTMTSASYMLFAPESNPSADQYEYVIASEVKFAVLDTGGTVNVRTSLRNLGSMSVQLAVLCVHATTKGWSSFNFCRLDVDLLPAQQILFDANVTFIDTSPYSTYHFESWLVTRKDNIVPLPDGIYLPSSAKPIDRLLGPPSDLFATNLDNFRYFNVTRNVNKVPHSWDLDEYPIGANANLVNQGLYGAFQVSLINIDKSFRDITLSRYSRLDGWYIVNVDETTGTIVDSFANLTLPFGVERKIYFASLVPIGFDPSSGRSNSFIPNPTSYTGRVSLLLIGKIGNNDNLYDDLPFASIQLE